VKLPGFFIELPIEPDRGPRLLPDAIAGCLEALALHPEISEALVMVATELIDNAVKYGDRSRPDALKVTVRCRAEDPGDHVEIEVTNPIAAPAAYQDIRAALAEMAELPSSRDAYLSCVRAHFAGRAADTSRLGLARVAYEGGCRIEAELMLGDVVRVMATLDPALIVSQTADLAPCEPVQLR
jgi:hypothetical protein